MLCKSTLSYTNQGRKSRQPQHPNRKGHRLLAFVQSVLALQFSHILQAIKHNIEETKYTDSIYVFFSKTRVKYIKGVFMIAVLEFCSVDGIRLGKFQLWCIAFLLKFASTVRQDIEELQHT